jgi:hypothetical protein
MAAQSMSEIHRTLRKALESYLRAFHWWTSDDVQKLRNVTDMDLAEEDILSMEDLAVACAKHFKPGVYPHSEIKQLPEDLLCLLKPVEEELLPPEGPTDRIWEIFAAAKKQHKQFSIVAVYAGDQRAFQKPMNWCSQCRPNSKASCHLSSMFSCRWRDKNFSAQSSRPR